MVKKGGLGRGLDALLAETKEEAKSGFDGEVIANLSIDAVHPNPGQPRKLIDQGELDELCESIREHGVIQPLIVKIDPTGGYMIIAGERRYQASKLAGLETVPCIVRDPSHIQMLSIALIENIQRSDLNAIEEAMAYKELMQEAGFTQEQLAGKVGKSRSTITNSLRLLDLPEEVQQMMIAGLLTAGHARAILMIEGDEARIALARQVESKNLSVRQTETLAAGKSGEKDSGTKAVKAPASYGRAAQLLTKSLGTKVKVVPGAKNSKIEITFKSEDELQRIIDALGNE